MSKPWKPRRETVELRPSRIRRDPVRAEKPAAPNSYWDPTEWEAWMVGIGVSLFGLAIAIIILGISDYTSQ